MISVAEALARVLALASPMPPEPVPLMQAASRVLLHDAIARRAQPPFAASAMDGYAVGGPAPAGQVFRIVSEARAGSAAGPSLGPGEAARIFTGAPVPEGTTRIIIQEDVIRDADRITIRDNADPSLHIRSAGGDFKPGFTLPAPRRLRPADLALLAAMNIDLVHVARRPIVALIATGDELVMPGEVPGPDQIVASNIFALRAMVEAAGGEARVLPIARDTEAALSDVLGLAAGADVIVTIGGASVGDHDLVARVASAHGLERSFYKIAMRPGKPLMAGRLNGAALLGLPGNPVSAIVCGHLFLLPLLHAMQGLESPTSKPLHARLMRDLGPNGPRAHYMRARLVTEGIAGAGLPLIEPFADQDSSHLTPLVTADALMIRETGEGPRKAGEHVPYIPL